MKTPLHEAARYENLEMVRELIANGADVNAKDHCNSTPLHNAARYGYLEIVRELIANGADVNTKNNYGCTPLHYAAHNGFLETVRELISNGAYVIYDNDGNVPLDLAIKMGRTEVAKLLEERMNQVDIKEPDCN
jgi:ankyrin repeat protein